MFVLLVLAAYRLTRLVTRDSIWEGTRDRLGARLVDQGSGLGAKVAELITCPYCAGVWVSALVVAFAAANNLIVLPLDAALITVPAVAGAQALCSAVDDRLNG